MKLKFASPVVVIILIAALLVVVVVLVQNANRTALDSARRVECANNLHNLALGMHEYHDVHRKLPPFSVNTEEHFGSWALMVLPYMEASAVFRQFDLHSPANSPENISLLADYRSPYWQCPTRRTNATYSFEGSDLFSSSPSVHKYLPTDYVAAHSSSDVVWSHEANGMIVNLRSNPSQGDFPGSVTNFASCVDGTSNTALIGEKHMHPDWLGQPEATHGWLELPLAMAADSPAFIRVGGDRTAHGAVSLAPRADFSTADDPNAVHMFGSWHEGLTLFANADASVRVLRNAISPEVLGYYIQRNDRQRLLEDSEGVLQSSGTAR